jgi:hypothetical protein
MMRAVLGLLAATLLTESADAQTKPDRWSANYLMPACQNFLAHRDTNLSVALDEGVCAGTVSGLNYLITFLPPHLISCIPKKATIGQRIRVALAYIERQPQRMHEDFRLLTVEAWHEAWPCEGAR